MSESALVKFGGGMPVSASDLKQGLQKLKADLHTTSGGLMYLKLDKQKGFFHYGPEKIKVEAGSKWAINPHSIQKGWSCWEGGEILGEQMVAYYEDMPARANLPNPALDWKENTALQMTCVSGTDKGLNLEFSAQSKGLKDAVEALADDISEQLDVDQKLYVPIVHLEVGDYENKRYGGVTYFPIFDVVDWAAFDTTETASGEDPDADEAESETGTTDSQRGRGGNGKADDSEPTKTRRGRRRRQ